MASEIDEEAERLTDKLHKWATDLGVPIDAINENAADWLEYLGYTDDPAIPEWIEFVEAQALAHTPDNQLLVWTHLGAAAMSLQCFHQTNRGESPAWGCLIRVTENLALLEGLLFSAVVEREARFRKLSKGGKKGAQVKHQGVSRLKQWAVSEAKGARGADKEISRQLALRIPGELVAVSKDPERVIYDAIRAARKSSS